MFGIGTWELVLIGVVLLIVVGPKSLPSMLRKVGTIVGELKNASRELRNQLDVEVGDIQREINSQKDEFLKTKDEFIDKATQPYKDLEDAERKFRSEVKQDVMGVDDGPYSEAALKATEEESEESVTTENAEEQEKEDDEATKGASNKPKEEPRG